MELQWRRLFGENGHEAGRDLLRALVGGELPEILLTPNGKPYFAGNMPHFSISHTPNYVFCCVSDRNIGIDAEEMDRRIDIRLAKRILSPSELEKYDGTEAMLLKFWVLKEAAAKLSGEGLRGYPKDTDFSADDPRIRIIDNCLVAVMEEEYAL